MHSVSFARIEQIFDRQKTREALIQCQELCADARVREVATKKLDQRVLAITSRELVAVERHYHKSCYHLKDTIPTRSDVSACTEQATELNYYQTIETLAFKELLSYNRNELIQSKSTAHDRSHI